MFPIESPPTLSTFWSNYDMATASAKSKQLLAEIAAKKTAKPAAKKPAPASKAAKVAPAPKPVAKKAAKPTEPRVLYTIRLEPSLVDKLKAKGTKDGVTHAEVARSAIAAYFGV